MWPDYDRCSGLVGARRSNRFPLFWVPDRRARGRGTMTVYSGPVYDMAVNQFAVIADHLSIPHDERDRLLLPKRALTISCPIRRRDGSDKRSSMPVWATAGGRVRHAGSTD